MPYQSIFDSQPPVTPSNPNNSGGYQRIFDTPKSTYIPVTQEAKPASIGTNKVGQPKSTPLLTREIADAQTRQLLKNFGVENPEYFDITKQTAVLGAREAIKNSKHYIDDRGTIEYLGNQVSRSIGETTLGIVSGLAKGVALIGDSVSAQNPLAREVRRTTNNQQFGYDNFLSPIMIDFARDVDELSRVMVEAHPNWRRRETFEDDTTFKGVLQNIKEAPVEYLSGLIISEAPMFAAQLLTYWASPWTAIAAMGAMSGGETYEDALAHGVNKDKAMTLGLIRGVVEAGLEKIGFDRILGGDGVKKMGSSLAKNFMHQIRNVSATSLIEGGTEMMQELSANALAATFDENKELMEKAWEELRKNPIKALGSQQVGDAYKALTRNTAKAGLIGGIFGGGMTGARSSVELGSQATGTAVEYLVEKLTPTHKVALAPVPVVFDVTNPANNGAITFVNDFVEPLRTQGEKFITTDGQVAKTPIRGSESYRVIDARTINKNQDARAIARIRPDQSAKIIYDASQKTSRPADIAIDAQGNFYASQEVLDAFNASQEARELSRIGEVPAEIASVLDRYQSVEELVQAKEAITNGFMRSYVKEIPETMRAKMIGYEGTFTPEQVHTVVAKEGKALANEPFSLKIVNGKLVATGKDALRLAGAQAMDLDVAVSFNPVDILNEYVRSYGYKNLQDYYARSKKARAHRNKKRGVKKTKKNISVQKAETLVRKYFTEEEVGVEFVESIRTPEGRRALGKYFNKMITFINDPKETTPEHEVLHAFFDLFTGKERKEAILNEVERKTGIKDRVEQEEWLADEFVNYARGSRKVKTLGQKILSYFKEMLTKIKTLIGKGDVVDELYKDIVGRKRPSVQTSSAEQKFQEDSDFLSEAGRVLRGTKGMTVDDIIKTYPNIQLTRDVPAKDIYGNKVTIPEGEKLTPYELKGNKILLQDGETYIVTKNQFQNIKGNSISAEGKPFAPELEGLEESVRKSVQGLLSEKEQEELSRRELAEYEETLKQNLGYEPTKYSQYTLPDGENYREVLIKAPLPKGEKLTRLPEGTEVWSVGRSGAMETPNGQRMTFNLVEGEDINDLALNALNKNIKPMLGDGGFKSSHWDEPNVISHLRLNDRTYKGKKVTFMEELQSDWAREGRSKGFAPDKAPTLEEYFKEGNIVEGYGGKDKVIKFHPADPNAPYPKNYWSVDVIAVNADGTPKRGESVRNHSTMPDLSIKGVPKNENLKNWQTLSIKRALKDAVDNNSDYFAWINGEQTSARYNLATYVDSVKWSVDDSSAIRKADGGKNVIIEPKGGRSRFNILVDKNGTITSAPRSTEGWKGKKLDEALGKGLADKIMEKDSGTLSGEGLKFGGEWANNLYDKQVKSIVEDLTGQKVEMLDMGLPVEEKKGRWVDEIGDDLKPKNLYVGKEVSKLQGTSVMTAGDSYIITDTLGDGKFNAVRKDSFDRMTDLNRMELGQDELEGFTEEELLAEDLRYANESEDVETFDISGKTTKQMGIKLTPQVKSRVRGEAPSIETSRQMFTEETGTKEAFQLDDTELLEPVEGELVEKQPQEVGLSYYAERMEALKSRILNAEMKTEQEIANAQIMLSGLLEFPDSELENSYELYEKMSRKYRKWFNDLPQEPEAIGKFLESRKEAVEERRSTDPKNYTSMFNRLFETHMQEDLLPGDILEMFNERLEQEQAFEKIAKQKTPSEKALALKQLATRIVRKATVGRKMSTRQAITKITKGSLIDAKKKIELSERKLLKMRFSVAQRVSRQVARSVRKEVSDILKAGFSKKTAELKRYQDVLTKLVNLLPREARTDNMVKLIKNVKNERTFADAYTRINFQMERYQKADYIKSIRKRLKRILGSPSVALEYKKAAEALLTEIQFTSPSTQTVRKLNALKTYLNREYELGNHAYIPTKVYDTLKRLQLSNIRDLSIDELQSIYEEMGQLEDIGRLKIHLEKRALERRKQVITEKVTPELVPYDKPELLRGEAGYELSKIERLKNLARRIKRARMHFGMAIRPMDVFFDLYSGGQGVYNTNFFRYFKAPIDIAVQNYLVERARYTNEVAQMAQNLGLKTANYERIGIYAARIQKDGTQKLLARGLSQQVIDSIELTQNEQLLYKKMREHFEAIYPSVKRHMRLHYNKDIGKLDDYFPFVMDFDAMSNLEIGERFGFKPEESFSGSPRKNYVIGATIERVANAKQAIQIDAMDIYLNHMDNAVYMTEVAGRVKELTEIAKQSAFKDALGEYGSEILLKWLDTLARKGGVEHGKQLNRVFDDLRRNIGAGTLALKVSSALMQPSAFFDGAAEIGASYATKGAFAFASDPAMRTFIMENAPELMARVGNDPAFQELSRNELLKKIQQLGFTPLQALDAYTASSITIGAYLKRLDELNLDLDLTKPNKDALAYAQLVLRRTQNSSYFKDLPLALSRGELTGNLTVDKLFFQFQSFMLNRWSYISYDLPKKLRNNPKQGVNALLWMTMASVYARSVSFAYKTTLAAIFGNEEEEDPFLTMLSQEILGTIPFVSTAWSSAEYRSAPVPVIRSAVDFFGGALGTVKSKEADTRAKASVRFITGAGMLLGVPGSVEARNIILEALSD